MAVGLILSFAKYKREKIMTRLISLFLVLICFNYVHADSATYDLQHYGDKIHVKASFEQSVASRKIKLQVPSEIWGTDYAQQIKNIKVIGGDYDVEKQIALLTRADQYLVIEYDVENVSREVFSKNFSDRYYHFIDKDKFFILGLGFFIYPENYDGNKNINATIFVNSKAKKVFSSIYPYLCDGKIETDFSKIERLVILGNNRFGYAVDESKNIATITWSSDKKLNKRLSAISGKALTQHSDFWNDYPKKTLIFIPNPFSSKVNRAGGVIMGVNTALIFTNPKNNDDQDLYDIINHEGLHFWIGSNDIVGPRWFTEGFTDYYMDKVNYHFTKDKSQLAEHYEEKLSAYAFSPARLLNEKALEEHFFKIKSAEKLPYLKGYLIAAQIDSVIDLDDAMRNMIHDCKNKKCSFSAELLFRYTKNISAKNKSYILNLIDNFDKTIFY